MNLPQGKNILVVNGSLYKTDGTVNQYKARLVAKEFIQTYGIYYTETLPVEKLNTVRISLSLATNLDQSF